MPADDVEVIKPRSQHLITATVGSTLDELLRRFSSWSKLQVCISWLVQFVQYLQSEPEPQMRPPLKDVSVVNMRASSRLIVKLVQRQCLQDDYIALGSGKQVKASSRLANLSPILLDGVIRVGGCLQNAPISTEAIHPMIVPNEHPVAILIIRNYHQILGHAGRKHVLAALRQCYWILNYRVLTRQVLRRCIDCRKRHEASMRQFMGELSRAWLTPYKPPFTYTGLDFFGTFHVKRGRSIEKVYRGISSCLTTRAIHIEDVGFLETDAFIQALRRFICIRGAAKEIWSDNGTNFIGGEKELKLARQEWNQTAIKHALHEKEVEWRCQPFQKWHFQPPHCKPHFWCTGTANQERADDDESCSGSPTCLRQLKDTTDRICRGRRDPECTPPLSQQ